MGLLVRWQPEAEGDFPGGRIHADLSGPGCPGQERPRPVSTRPDMKSRPEFRTASIRSGSISPLPAGRDERLPGGGVGHGLGKEDVGGFARKILGDRARGRHKIRAPERILSRSVKSRLSRHRDSMRSGSGSKRPESKGLLPVSARPVPVLQCCYGP